MTTSEALDKIKKLLRMKRGGTIAEVETALALAAELARKHGIDLAGVNPDEESDADANSASMAGYSAGRDTEIRSGLNDQGKATPMLTC